MTARLARGQARDVRGGTDLEISPALDSQQTGTLYCTASLRCDTFWTHHCYPVPRVPCGDGHHSCRRWY
jgi:hypothetical protein